MNYAHNNLRLKKLQFRTHKLHKHFNRLLKFLKPDKIEIEIETEIERNEIKALPVKG